MRRVALAAYALGVLALVVFGLVPFMTEKRDLPAAITSPPPLESTSLEVLQPRDRLCMDEMTIEPHAQQARFTAGSYGLPGMPLQVTVTGPGYHATRLVRGGWADNSTLAVPVPPPKRSELVTVCIRNAGYVKVALYSAAERARSRTTVVLDGKRQPASPSFGFWEARPVSLADRLGTTVDRIAVFRGPLDHAWIVWILLVLFVAGLPLTLGRLLWRAYAYD